jgi:hypothetical protein
MTFERFVNNVDAVVRTNTPAEYGLYAGPHVAFWQQGAITARVREGTAGDVELDVARDEPTIVRTTCDARGAQHVAETILATWG